ncbi:MAG: putative nucleotide-diphospho-sugar transferase [bacterium]
MKLISTYSPSHRPLAESWFLPSLKDDYEVFCQPNDIEGPGSYMMPGWSKAVAFKSQTIIQAIKDNRGDSFIYSDVDIQFFASTKSAIRKALQGHDIVCLMDDPEGLLCTGFFAIRANRLTLQLWERVARAVETEGRDQLAFNDIVRQIPGLRYGLLPYRFFGPGTFRRKRWEPGERIYIPFSPYLFHANWTLGIHNKSMLLQQVKTIVQRGRPGILANNLLYLLHCGPKFRAEVSKAKAVTRSPRVNHSATGILPARVTLEASTLCQLNCPTCPTALGITRERFGAGFLAFTDFKQFADHHPQVSEIELSNWGEVFLNPELGKILEYAHAQNITLTLRNGANLNTVSPEILEALVRFRLHSLSCSIDGASQATYSQYRKNGNFESVIRNIESLNTLKAKFKSPYPGLAWQFVAFGHNEHEIESARQMARKLHMRFALKLSWDDLYSQTFSPIRNRTLLRSQSPMKVADRAEYEIKFGESYISRSCLQLWHHPRINFDGRLLGCSINHWGDFGNVFENGLAPCLEAPPMQRARQMLMGALPKQDDLPCSHCTVYHHRLQSNRYVRPQELDDLE